MEKFSKKMLALAPDFKKGEIYEFKLTNLRKRKDGTIIPADYLIPSIYSIYDVGDQETKTINLVDKIIPGRKGKEDKIKLKDIVFEKVRRGKYICDGNKPRDKEIFYFLYFSPWNASNRGNDDYHIPSPAGYLYTYVDKAQNELMSVDKKKKILAAQHLAMTIEDDQLKIICEQLGKDKAAKFAYSESMSVDSLRLALSRFAEKFPQKVNMLNDDVDLALRSLINDSMENDIIFYDKPLQRIAWSDSRETIVMVPPGKEAKTVLVGYLLTTDGEMVREVMLNALNAKGVEEYQEQ